ncbi:MAG: protein kinase [Gemmataceae bacterium]|nr:protein kinase [Gemmataceae bacterium]
MTNERVAIPCPVEEAWQQWLVGALAPPEHEIYDDHVTQCEDCQSVLERLTTVPAWSWLSGEVPIAVEGESPEIGFDIPDIRLIAEAGRGGHGVVYRAIQIALDREVAVKLLRHGIAATDNERARIMTEAASFARLRHPNIIQVFTTGEVNGCPYLVMEWADGGSLADELDGTPWNPASAAETVETLSRALHAAHIAGVIHRDFKPENVLFFRGDNGATPKVGDFGLAKLVDTPTGRTTSMTILGTPNYMAPEQAIGGEKAVGPATDVYALGAVLYELLTGRPPFVADTPFETLLRVREEEPLAPRNLQPKIPRDLETICLHCLHKNPTRRFATALALAEDLRRFQEGRPIVARPVGWIEKSVKWIRRHPLRTMLAIGLMTAVVASVVAVLEIQRRTELAARVVRARTLVDGLLACEPAEVSRLLEEFEQVRESGIEYLLRKNDESPAGSAARLKANLALAKSHPEVIPELLGVVSTVTPADLMLIRDAVRKQAVQVADQFWPIALDSNRPAPDRLRAAALLAVETPQWDEWTKIAGEIAGALVAENPIYIERWSDAFRPVSQVLVQPLWDLARDTGRSETDRTVAAGIAAGFSVGDARKIAAEFLELETRPGMAILPAARKNRDITLDVWTRAVSQITPAVADEVTKDRHAKQRVRAALGLWHLNRPDHVHRFLGLVGPDVRERYFLMQLLAGYDINPEFLVREIQESPDAAARRSAIVSLGDYSRLQWNDDRRAGIRPQLERMFLSDPDSGVHGAIDWLVGRAWGHKNWPPALPRSFDPAPNTRWYVAPSGTTMTVVRGPVEFDYGSEPTEPHHAGGEERSRRRITHDFAIATREVTVAEFRQFLAACPGVIYAPPDPDDLKNEQAIRRVSWPLAQMYCRWLCEKEGIPDADMPYPPIPEISEKISYPPRFLERGGYRLPTEEEWEHSCRAGTVTPRFYGFEPAQLSRYGWALTNSEDSCHAGGLLRPNDLGMFDVYGNVWEWTQPAPYQPFSASNRKSTLLHLDVTYKPEISMPYYPLICRGGSYIYHAPFVRSAKRYMLAPVGDTTVGFRIARTLRAPAKSPATGRMAED